jgi:hypothetical protein
MFIIILLVVRKAYLQAALELHQSLEVAPLWCYVVLCGVMWCCVVLVVLYGVVWCYVVLCGVMTLAKVMIFCTSPWG